MSGQCAVCGSNAGVERAQENGYTLLQCTCGAMFLDRSPPEDTVDPTFDPHPDNFYKLGAPIRIDWIRRYGRTNGTFFEVGCGEGHLLAVAKARQFDVAGIECSPGRARRTEKRLDVPIEVALLEESRRADASCDIVYHCDLLSHFPDPERALRRMRAMLRPDGIMAFEVGLVGGLSPEWYNVGSLQLPHHRWFYSVGALERLLRSAGFRIIACKRFGMGVNFDLSRLAGALRLGGGASRPKIFSEYEQVYRDARTGQREITQRELGWPQRLRAHAYAFTRYRVGALTPNYGPGTAFFIASPV